MEAASEGARPAGGLVVARLPGTGPDAANPHAEVVIPTGLGDARNAPVAPGDRARSAGGLGGPRLPVRRVDDPVAAVRLAVEFASSRE